MSNSGSVSRASSYSPTEPIEYTPLQLAVHKGSLDEARLVASSFKLKKTSFLQRYLLENGEDVNAGLDPPLHIAIRRKDASMARLLLQTGADFEMKDSVFPSSKHQNLPSIQTYL